jgi:type II secretion system protein I
MRNCGWRRAACGVGSRTKRPDSITDIRSPNASGFTLLEVMVAVSIMAMVLVTLLGLKNRSMQDVMSAEHITTATMLAKREIVKTITTNPLKKWMPDEQEGDFAGEEDFSGYAWKKKISLIPISNDVFITEIRVAILWKEGDRQETVELVDYE